MKFQRLRFWLLDIMQKLWPVDRKTLTSVVFIPGRERIVYVDRYVQSCLKHVEPSPLKEVKPGRYMCMECIRLENTEKMIAYTTRHPGYLVKHHMRMKHIRETIANEIPVNYQIEETVNIRSVRFNDGN